MKPDMNIYTRKFQCMKCGDKYTLKKNSMRFHCRNHRPFDIYGFCIDCRFIFKINSCCFHVKKQHYFSSFL